MNIGFVRFAVFWVLLAILVLGSLRIAKWSACRKKRHCTSRQSRLVRKPSVYGPSDQLPNSGHGGNPIIASRACCRARNFRDGNGSDFRTIRAPRGEPCIQVKEKPTGPRAGARPYQ
jgi:hypothetical protein